jgi:hypothetical protein
MFVDGEDDSGGAAPLCSRRANRARRLGEGLAPSAAATAANATAIALNEIKHS